LFENSFLIEREVLKRIKIFDRFQAHYDSKLNSKYLVRNSNKIRNKTLVVILWLVSIPFRTQEGRINELKA